MKGNLAVVGCGNWGRNLVRNFCQLLGEERVICCDQNTGGLQELQQQFPMIQVTNDFADVLNDPSIEAVALATPTQTHFTLARDLSLMDKHLFVEKPLATSVQDAWVLCDMTRERNRVLMVDHLMLFHPAIQELTSLVRNGELGDIYHIYGRRTNLGVVRSEENVLWSLGPHDVAVMLDIVGEMPTSVTAQGGTFLQLDLGVQDIVFLNLNFPDGQVGSIQLSWLDPRKTREVTVIGSKKMALFDDMEPEDKLRLYDKSVEISSYDGVPEVTDGDVVNVPFSGQEPLALACKHFLDGIEYGRTEISNGESGLDVVRVLECAQRSLDLGGIPVELSAALASD